MTMIAIPCNLGKYMAMMANAKHEWINGHESKHDYRDPKVKPKIHMDSATIIRIHMAMSQNMSEP